MLLVWRMRQDIKLQEVRALISSIIIMAPAGSGDDKKMTDVWNTFQEAMFPFRTGLTQKQDMKAIDYLRSEAARGPLNVVPLAPLNPSPHRRRKP